MKRQATDQEKIFAYLISGKGVYKIYEELVQLKKQLSF